MPLERRRDARNKRSIDFDFAPRREVAKLSSDASMGIVNESEKLE